MSAELRGTRYYVAWRTKPKGRLNLLCSDDAGRLEEVLRDGARVAFYTYDPNGNRTTVETTTQTITADYDAQDRLERYGNNVYTYRDSGELLTKTASGEQTTYDYDELGNLMSVVLPGNSVIEYEIDPLNRRVGKKFDGQVTRRWIYKDQLNPVAELDADGNLVALFIYGTRAHVPDAMVKDGIRYLFVTDQIGSVRLVVNAETGAVVQRMDYDAWGNVILDSNPSFQPFGFAGGMYDRDTKLLRFGVRDYDPEVGRWTAKDPIGFAGGQANLYVYLANSPTNYFDPTGQYWQVPAAVAAAALAIWILRGLEYGCTAERAAEDLQKADDKKQEIQDACNSDEDIFDVIEDPHGRTLEEQEAVKRRCNQSIYDAVQFENFRALEAASDFGKSTPPSPPKVTPR